MDRLRGPVNSPDRSRHGSGEACLAPTGDMGVVVEFAVKSIPWRRGDACVASDDESESTMEIMP